MRKNTKRALILSCLSLLLCVSMLVGSTMAWFTDNATTAVNKIEAGTLDIALEMYENGQWVNAEGKTLDFIKSAFSQDANILWEPGAAYKLPQLRIRNAGNLAMKFKVELNGILGDAKLNEAIDWTFNYTIDWDENADGNFDRVTAFETLNKGGWALIPENSDGIRMGQGVSCYYLDITGTMKQTAGNEYQGLSIEGASITLNATQLDYEHDSTWQGYDKDAQYDKLVNVHNQEELNAIIANATEPVTLVLSGDTYTLPDLTNKTVTFSGVENTVIDTTSNKGSTSGASLIFDGVTVKFSANGTYGNNGFTHAKAVTYKDCVIEGQQFLYAPNNTFTNCTFENTGDNYNVWTYGTNATFTDCTFDCDGKAVLIYTEGQVTASYTFTDCIFNDRGSVSGKAAVEVGESAYGNKANYTINMTGCTVNGFDTTTQNSSTFGGTKLGTNVWGNKNMIPADRLNVIIDGVNVY